MAKFPVDILKMALDPLADSAEAIVRNISDVPADKAGALTRMADDAVDDWGWKGGKPGEVTGTDYVHGGPPGASTLFYRDNPEARKARNKQLNIGVRQLDRYASKSPDAGISQEYIRLKDYYGNKKDAARYVYRDMFVPLERAGVPREWTGKVANAIWGARLSLADAMRMTGMRTSIDIHNNLAKAVSNAMRGMYVEDNPELTKQYRETFLALLPDWEGSIENLAIAARSFVD